MSYFRFAVFFQLGFILAFTLVSFANGADSRTSAVSIGIQSPFEEVDGEQFRDSTEELKQTEVAIDESEQG